MTKREINESLHNEMIRKLTLIIIEKDKTISMLQKLLRKRTNFKQIYKDYLKSKEWNKIRIIVFRRDKNTCKKCGKRGTEVHHLTYENIFNEENHLKDLITVCRDCHNNIHKKEIK